MISKLWQGLANRTNPVLMKEMRQAMRSRHYTLIFLVIQVIMVFYLVFGMALSQGSGNSEDMDTMFWVILGVFLLVILPLFATNALSSERRESRLDLLVLTRLSARRITYGKWFAVVGQGALIITALLPYLVLRYYIGSVEFHESLLLALILLLCSAVVTGIAVSISVINSVVLRWFVLLGLGFWGIPFLLGLAFSGYMDYSDLLYEFPMLLITGGLVVALAIEFSAASISPIRDNHDTPKRMILLAFLAMIFVALFFDFDSEFAIGLFVSCYIVVLMDGLCRQASNSPPVYESFVRFGLAGRLAGRFLYPGWLPSICFSFLIMAALVMISTMQAATFDTSDNVMLFIAIGVFAFPFAIILYTPLVRMRYGRMMLLIQLCLCLITLLLFMIDETTKLQSSTLACWIPTSAFLMSINEDPFNPADTSGYVYLIASSITTAISLILIAIKAIPQWRMATTMQGLAVENLRSRKERQALPKPPVLVKDSNAL